MRGDEEQPVDLTICPRCHGPREVRQAASVEGEPMLLSFSCVACAYEVTPAIPQRRIQLERPAPLRTSGGG